MLSYMRFLQFGKRLGVSPCMSWTELNLMSWNSFPRSYLHHLYAQSIECSIRNAEQRICRLSSIRIRTYLHQTTLSTSLRNPQAQEVLKVIESLRIWKKKVRLCEKITSLPLVMKRSFIQKMITLVQMHSILWWILIPSRNVYIYIPSIGKKKLNIYLQY